MKSPLASTTALIRDRNFLQAQIMTSLSMSIIKSKIKVLREARSVMRVFIDLSLNYVLHEII
jgi:hypothetical protein